MNNLIQKWTDRDDGFTLMELVVTVVLLGILVSASIPAYNGVAERTQGKRNEANMQTIREVFFIIFTGCTRKRAVPPTFLLRPRMKTV